MSLEAPTFNLLDKEAPSRLYHGLPQDEVRRGINYLNKDNLTIADNAKQGISLLGPQEEVRRMSLLYPEIADILVDKAGIANIFHDLGFTAAPRGLIIPMSQSTGEKDFIMEIRRLEGITGQSGDTARWHIKPERGVQGRGARPIEGYTNLVQAFIEEKTNQAAAHIEQLKPFENYVLQEQIPFAGILPEIQNFKEMTGKNVGPRIRAVRLITTDAAGNDQTHIGAWHYVGSSITPSTLAEKKFAPHYKPYEPVHRLFYRNLQNEVIPVTTNPDFQQMLTDTIDIFGMRLQDHFRQKMPFISFDAAITPKGYEALQTGNLEAFIKEGFAPWELQPMPGWGAILLDPISGKPATEMFRSTHRMMRAFAYGSVKKP